MVTDDAMEEAAHWRRKAALLPRDDAQGVLDRWESGEQEAGLRLIVSGLRGRGVPMAAPYGPRSP